MDKTSEGSFRTVPKILPFRYTGKVRGNRGENMERKKTWIYLLTAVVIICGWIGMAYMGYQQAVETLETSVKEIKLEHSLQIQEIEAAIQEVNMESVVLRRDVNALNEEIRTFNDGLDDMLIQLEIIDTNIIDSEQVQLEISSYLDELDERLSALQKSLEILEVAPDEKN